MLRTFFLTHQWDSSYYSAMVFKLPLTFKDKDVLESADSDADLDNANTAVFILC